jgi:hypothetical protein
MSIAPSPTPTLEQLLASEDGGRYEIVGGQLEEIQVGVLSIAVASRVQIPLGSYCLAHGIGEVFSGSTTSAFEDETRSRRPMVWEINPEERVLLLYRAGSNMVERIEAGGLVRGGDVIPGFECVLSDLLV